MSDFLINPMITLNIHPIEKIIKRSYNTVDIIDMNVKLYEGATVKINLRGDGYIETQILEMTKDEYNEWMDDDYIKQWVLSKLNAFPA